MMPPSPSDTIEHFHGAYALCLDCIFNTALQYQKGLLSDLVYKHMIHAGLDIVILGETVKGHPTTGCATSDARLSRAIMKPAMLVAPEPPPFVDSKVSCLKILADHFLTHLICRQTSFYSGLSWRAQY